MKRKILVFTTCISISVGIFSCGGNSQKADPGTDASASQSSTTGSNPDDYDPHRGEGKFDASNVSLGALDKTMADRGEAIANTKCTSCHKLSEERLVGPGWKGVTERRAPYWIMNFITNPDPMIDKDPEVQAQLELCLVRMPNQSLSDQDARDVLEFMRKNDGVN